MKKDTILVAVVALIAGLIIGWMAWQKSFGPAPVAAPSTTGVQSAASTQQKIDKIKAIVASDPKNRQAWVTLGNEYFDADRPMEAVDAYQKALELNGEDPNVLTDQGVMFRRLGWFDRAIANFSKANQIDPKHITSLFNLGIVYRYDVQDFAKAEEAWTRFLALNPSGQGSDRARQELEFIRTHPTTKQP